MGWKKLIAGVIMFVILLGIRQVIHQPLLSVALMVIVGGGCYILILTLLKDSFIEVGSKLVFGKFMHK